LAFTNVGLGAVGAGTATASATTAATEVAAPIAAKAAAYICDAAACWFIVHILEAACGGMAALSAGGGPRTVPFRGAWC
jgi:hypothetical protein